MRNADLDLGEVTLEERSRTAPRHPRRRWPAVVVAGAVAASIALVTTGADDPDEPEPPPSPTTTVPSDIRVSSPRLLDEIVVLGAPVGYEQTGSLASIDIAGRRLARRDRDVRLWPGDFAHPLLVVGDRLVWADLDDAWAVPLDLASDPVVIGKALQLVPAIDADHVWLHRLDGSIAKVDRDGTIAIEATLPDAAHPIADVDGGLLLDVGDDLVVWDPATGENRRVYDARAVLAASRSRALLDDGLVLDLATGQPVDQFVGDTARAAAFAPDGSRLAAWLGTPGTRSAGIAIYDVRSGARQFHLLQSIETVVGSLAWSPSGDAVYVMVSSDGATGDRVIGIPVGGSPQTVATFGENGWYWIAVGQPSTR